MSETISINAKVAILQFCAYSISPDFHQHIFQSIIKAGFFIFLGGWGGGVGGGGDFIKAANFFYCLIKMVCYVYHAILREEDLST